MHYQVDFSHIFKRSLHKRIDTWSISPSFLDFVGQRFRLAMRQSQATSSA